MEEKNKFTAKDWIMMGITIGAMVVSITLSHADQSKDIALVHQTSEETKKAVLGLDEDFKEFAKVQGSHSSRIAVLENICKVIPTISSIAPSSQKVASYNAPSDYKTFEKSDSKSVTKETTTKEKTTETVERDKDGPLEKTVDVVNETVETIGDALGL